MGTTSDQLSRNGNHFTDVLLMLEGSGIQLLMSLLATFLSFVSLFLLEGKKITRGVHRTHTPRGTSIQDTVQLQST